MIGSLTFGHKALMGKTVPNEGRLGIFRWDPVFNLEGKVVFLGANASLVNLGLDAGQHEDVSILRKYVDRLSIDDHIATLCHGHHPQSLARRL